MSALYTANYANALNSYSKPKEPKEPYRHFKDFKTITNYYQYIINKKGIDNLNNEDKIFIQKYMSYIQAKLEVDKKFEEITPMPSDVESMLKNAQNVLKDYANNKLFDENFYTNNETLEEFHYNSLGYHNRIRPKVSSNISLLQLYYNGWFYYTTHNNKIKRKACYA